MLSELKLRESFMRREIVGNRVSHMKQLVVILLQFHFEIQQVITR